MKWRMLVTVGITCITMIATGCGKNKDKDTDKDKSGIKTITDLADDDLEEVMQVKLSPYKSNTIKTPDGALSMMVPAGAVSSEVALTIYRIREAKVPNFVVGKAFLFKPEGLQFEKDVTLSFALDDGSHSEHLRVARLDDASGKIYVLNDQTWANLTKTVSGKTIHLSSYGVVNKEKLSNDDIDNDNIPKTLSDGYVLLSQSDVVGARDAFQAELDADANNAQAAFGLSLTNMILLLDSQAVNDILAQCKETPINAAENIFGQNGLFAKAAKIREGAVGTIPFSIQEKEGDSEYTNSTFIPSNYTVLNDEYDWYNFDEKSGQETSEKKKVLRINVVDPNVGDANSARIEIEVDTLHPSDSNDSLTLSDGLELDVSDLNGYISFSGPNGFYDMPKAGKIKFLKLGIEEGKEVSVELNGIELSGYPYFDNQCSEEACVSDKPMPAPPPADETQENDSGETKDREQPDDNYGDAPEMVSVLINGSFTDVVSVEPDISFLPFDDIVADEGVPYRSEEIVILEQCGAGFSLDFIRSKLQILKADLENILASLTVVTSQENSNDFSFEIPLGFIHISSQLPSNVADVHALKASINVFIAAIGLLENYELVEGDFIDLLSVIDPYYYGMSSSCAYDTPPEKEGETSVKPASSPDGNSDNEDDGLRCEDATEYFARAEKMFDSAKLVANLNQHFMKKNLAEWTLEEDVKIPLEDAIDELISALSVDPAEGVLNFQNGDAKSGSDEIVSFLKLIKDSLSKEMTLSLTPEYKIHLVDFFADPIEQQDFVDELIEITGTSTSTELFALLKGDSEAWDAYERNDDLKPVDESVFEEVIVRKAFTFPEDGQECQDKSGCSSTQECTFEYEDKPQPAYDLPTTYQIPNSTITVSCPDEKSLAYCESCYSPEKSSPPNAGEVCEGNQCAHVYESAGKYCDASNQQTYNSEVCFWFQQACLYNDHGYSEPTSGYCENREPQFFNYDIVEESYSVEEEDVPDFVNKDVAGTFNELEM